MGLPRARWACAVLACALTIASAAVASAAPRPGRCAGAGAPLGASAPPVVAGAVLCLVNAQRRAAGVAPLRRDRRLTAAARAHAFDMVLRGYFSHDSPDGGTGSQRVEREGYDAAAFGEVIGAGEDPVDTAGAIVGAWMASAPHRAILLSPLYRDTGVAVVPGTPEAAPGATFVQDLGRR